MTGIDVSHHQGVISWPGVAGDGIDWAICKATEGTTFVDRRWQLNRAGARAAGVTVGAYHFARPGSSAAASQVDHHLAVATPAPGDIVPALDLEDHGDLSRTALTRWALDWIAEATARTGSVPILYTGPGFVRAHLHPDPALARCALWLAHYTTRPAPTVPAPWSAWSMWQHTDRGRVAGIAGPVDRNRTRYVPLHQPTQHQELTVKQYDQLRADIAGVKADVWIAADFAKRAADAAAKGLTLTQEDYEADLITLAELRQLADDKER